MQAKFKCEEVRKTTAAEQVTLVPVYSADKKSPNYSWSQATPAGKLELTISNTNAFGTITPGKEYLLTIVPAE